MKQIYYQSTLIFFLLLLPAHLLLSTHASTLGLVTLRNLACNVTNMSPEHAITYTNHWTNRTAIRRYKVIDYNRTYSANPILCYPFCISHNFKHFLYGPRQIHTRTMLHFNRLYTSPQLWVFLEFTLHFPSPNYRKFTPHFPSPDYRKLPYFMLSS
jgi:hypothetical protein